MIRLDDFLKSEGWVGTGGEAKTLIQSGQVRVNEEVETRRRRQLHPGDKVQLGNEIGLVSPSVDQSERLR